ncbi:methyltransferase [Pseudonocardia spinosispora]|uniref:methyltransferase n=1 Tax=Pseudonocardia spinosispora TaxID=103441 RepID=UPI000424496D|nr:methyltransferase [Pseudonocardia spinosispora]
MTLFEPRHHSRDGSSPADPRAVIWDMITAYRVSQIVRTAALFSLAEHCAEGTVTAGELARAESADPAATARFLRACAAVGLTTSHDGLHFTGTALLDTLRRDAEGSQWGFAVSLPAPGHWQPWGKLPAAIRAGTSQADQPIFDYYTTHPDEEAAFATGLDGMTAVAGSEAAAVLDTSGSTLAVDVGGSTGTLMHALMAVNPTLRGVVMDVPTVLPHAVAAAEALGLSDRLSVSGGDFFASVPSGGDLYLLRYVLHDWNDEQCIRILSNCRTAMAPGGRVCVLEMLLGEVGAEQFAVPGQDLSMLAVLQGRERSLSMFDPLFEAAGLRRIAVHPTGSPLAVIEAQAIVQ